MELTEEPGLLTERFEALKKEIINVAGDVGYAEMRNKLSTLKQDVRELNRRGIIAVGRYDADFPEQLKGVTDAPVLLFVKGEPKVLRNRAIAVVGPRKPSRYAEKVAEQFSKEFVRAGLTVVSGLARGVDSSAHAAAVAEGGITVAVLGCGLDTTYPAENAGLAASILDGGGAIVSEYPLGEKPLTYHFPERNRIVSGLSEGVFLPEAGEKSGSLNTVRHASEQGREIFVVPTMINQSSGAGSNKLLRDMKNDVVLTLEPEDVFIRLGLSKPLSGKATVAELNFTEQRIAAFLEEKGESHFEEILAETGLSAGELGAVLFEMEMKGVVEKTTGNYYAVF